MAEGGDGGVRRGEGTLCFLKTAAQLLCHPVVLLGLAAIPQAHITTVSSPERPVKILTAPL